MILTQQQNATAKPLLRLPHSMKSSKTSDDEECENSYLI